MRKPNSNHARRRGDFPADDLGARRGGAPRARPARPRPRHAQYRYRGQARSPWSWRCPAWTSSASSTRPRPTIRRRQSRRPRRQLAKPLGLFSLPAAAGCTVAEAKVAIEAEHHHDGDDDDHDADHKDGAKGDHDQGDHDEHAGHNEFRATYAFDCTVPAELTTINFDYFTLFAGAHDLTVNVVTAKGQSKYEVSRDKPTLDLGGIM